MKSRIPKHKAILRLNLDETSVCLHQGTGKGNVFISRKRRVTQRVSRQKRRCCITHVALICDQPHIQPLLPQVLVGNHATFLVRDMEALRASCPPNLILVRQQSAWNNKLLCARIIRWLGLALAPHSDRYQPVLLLDGSRIHFAREVLLACRRAGIWVVFIPARMTWLMQPLDTHAFRRYKQFLREAYQNARISNATSELCIHDFLQCLYSTIRSVLQGLEWDRAFDQDGFGSQQRLLSSAICANLQATTELLVPSDHPTPDEIALCFPRRTVVPHALLFQCADLLPHVVALPAAAAIASGSVSTQETVSFSAGHALFPRAVPLFAPAALAYGALGSSANPPLRRVTRSQTSVLRRFGASDNLLC